MIELHLGDKKMQRAYQNQLRRVDPSFMVADSRRDNQSNERRTENVVSPTIMPQPPPASPPPAVIPVRANPNLLFGSSIGQLANKLQSLSLYEQRNHEILSQLSTEFHQPASSIERIKALCQSFQLGKINAVELVSKIDLICGLDAMKSVFPKLIDLQLDLMKKDQMANEFRNFCFRVESFPALPKSSAPSLAKASGVAPPRVLQLKAGSEPSHPRSIFVSRNAGPLYVSDPAKNPLKLLPKTSSIYAASSGASSSEAGKSKKKQPAPPSFNQALRVGPAASVGIDEKKLPVATFALDNEQYPSLVGSSKKTSIREEPTATMKTTGNVFTDATDTTRPESFVIGADDEREKSTTNGKGKKVKKKGQLVLQFGKPIL